MKFTKIAMAAVFALTGGSAYAFHSGGVGECEGCHTMHNSHSPSENGVGATVSVGMTLNGTPIGTTNPFLLQGADQSSTCLNCHAHTPAGSYHILSVSNQAQGNAIVAANANFTPGGDFMWLNNEFTYTGYEGVATQAGQRGGHNVVAADFGIVPDTRPIPPGSDGGALIGWNGTGFACVSCHDPHGRYRYTSSTAGTFTTQGPAISGSGSYADSRGTPIVSFAAGITSTVTLGAYRILGGVGYVPKSGVGPVFQNSPPIALAPSTYNAQELISGTAGKWNNQVQVAYGTGMSEWCMNCHPQMHSNTTEGATVSGLTIHPAGSTAHLSAAIAGNYNGYISTGNFSAAATDNYDSLVPFEVGSSDLDTVKLGANVVTIPSGSGPSAATSTYKANAASTTSNVMCLSCHRAHASAFNSMTRWYNDGEFVTSTAGWATAKGGSTSGAMNQATTQIGYYMRPAASYGSYQRSLCNKCHNKD